MLQEILLTATIIFKKVHKAILHRMKCTDFVLGIM